MTTSPVKNSASIDRVTFSNDAELLSDVLRPYARPKTQYLKSAKVSVANGLASAQGEFAIPYSCYIDETGHLNAVEVNICFNQLMYYKVAKCVQEQAVPLLGAWTMDDYWAMQLPDMLIGNLTCKFRRPIDSSSFHGEVSMAEFSERNRTKPVLIIDMPFRFWDDNGGLAEGEVRMAYVNPPGMRSQAGLA